MLKLKEMFKWYFYQVLKILNIVSISSNVSASILVELKITWEALQQKFRWPSSALTWNSQHVQRQWYHWHGKVRNLAQYKDRDCHLAAEKSTTPLIDLQKYQQGDAKCLYPSRNWAIWHFSLEQWPQHLVVSIIDWSLL
jgi:hypothetical protein